MGEEERKENKSTRAKEHKCIRAQVGEEERKGKHKAARIISRIARIAGIASFLCGLLLVPFTLWFAIYPDAGHDLDFIGMLLTVVAVSSFCVSFFYGPSLLLVWFCL